MQKRLNAPNANAAMSTAGLTQTAVAESLGVTKEAVSQWLNDKSFPRPNKLLQLGKLLGLSLAELVIKEDPYAPKVAFRKAKGTKTKDHHIEKAQEMGRFLRHLAPFLPFDSLEMPPVLKNPDIDYDYLQKVALKVRRDINLDPASCIDFTHLIRRFRELQAVIIPVLWGSKQNHGNAVHIYLPDSETTWVYLNLDVNAHDFKFWMAHELGHCLSPDLSGDAAEDFADAFAGALLFPKAKAESAYKKLHTASSSARKLTCLVEIATHETISPFTVYKEVNKFAQHKNKPPIAIADNQLHGCIANFNKRYNNISEALLGDLSALSAKDYILHTEQAFATPFFDALRQYLKQSSNGAGIVQAILDMPLLDAQGIHSELT